MIFDKSRLVNMPSYGLWSVATVSCMDTLGQTSWHFLRTM